MFHFTIRDVLWLTALVAVGCVGLKFASPVWVSILFSLLIFLLSASALGAIFQTGLKKASCLGLALTGGLYFLLAFGPGFSETVAPGLPSGTVVQNHLYPLLSREVPASSVNMPNGTPLAAFRGNVSYVTVPFLPDYTRVSHALGVLAAGFVGAIIARWFASTPRSASQTPEP